MLILMNFINTISKIFLPIFDLSTIYRLIYSMKVGLLSIKGRSKNLICTAILTILVVVTLRIFLFASFSIPSASMAPTLLPGDHIIVNKMIPGPRFDWLTRALSKNKKSTFRGWGVRSILRKDVLVFNAPYHTSDNIEKNLNVYYIKRCAGIPGDTLYIKNGIYVLKNEQQSSSISLPFTGHVDEFFQPEMFKAFGWTLTKFGPLYIPKKLDTIPINLINIYVYKRLIEYETNKKITIDENKVYLDGHPFNEYIFKQNYYFVIGDDAVDSNDSRYWGLLPEDHIVGRASFIWKSVDPQSHQLRLNRTLKYIN